MDLTFQGVPQPIRLVDCAKLVPLMRKIIASWPFIVIESDPAVRPVIVLGSEGNGHYRIEAPWLAEPIEEESDVGAVCSFIIDLVRAWFDAHPEFLCMHCSAAQFAERLVVFPSTSRAGKSTLMVRLAADGVAIHADDLLPITSGDGMSLGILPRLRLPLPDTAGVKLARFVRQNSGPADSRYRYLELPAPLLAPFGNTCPIGAFVLLERQAHCTAELIPTPRGSGLQHVVQQNYVRPGSAVISLARLRALIEARPCYRLVYSDLDEAVDLLKTSFASAVRDAFVPPVANAATICEPVDVSAAAGAVLCQRKTGPFYVRNPDVTVQTLDAESFLVFSDAIFCLNSIACAIWELLAEPLSEAEATRLIRAAFPDLNRRRAHRDIRILFADLKTKGLIFSTQIKQRSNHRLGASGGTARMSIFDYAPNASEALQQQTSQP
jgi:hypothetical protein